MKNITHSNINKGLTRIKEAGISPVTDMQRLQQHPDFGRIIYPAGESQKSGLIMSFTEANRRFTERFPEASFTKEQYKEMLNNLYDLYSDRFTLIGETKAQTDYMVEFVKDHLTESDIDDEQLDKFENLSFKEKRDIYRKAKSIAAKKGDPNYDADNFTAKLSQLINEL